MPSAIEPGPGLRTLLGVLRLQPEPSAEILTVPAEQSEPLAEEARRHAVLPLLGWLVQIERIRLPKELAAHLRKEFIHNTARALAAGAVTARITEKLGRAGIPTIALKGVALSQLLYGQPGVRQVGDVDLWIPPEQVLSADQIVRGEGYRRISPAADLSANQWRLYRSMRHEFAYLEPQHGFRVELQWKLSNCGALAIGSHGEALGRSRTVALPGSAIPFLGDQDLLLHLCIHGSVEGWPKLKWLSDVAALFHRLDAASARDLARTARSRGLERLLGVAVLLSREMLHAPADEDLAALLGSGSPDARHLARIAAATLILQTFLPGGGATLKESLETLAYRFKLGASLRYRAQALATDFLIPEQVLTPALSNAPVAALVLLCAAKTQLERVRHRFTGSLAKGGHG